MTGGGLLLTAHGGRAEGFGKAETEPVFSSPSLASQPWELQHSRGVPFPFLTEVQSITNLSTHRTDCVDGESLLIHTKVIIG